jgi:hypothetical protein
MTMYLSNAGLRPTGFEPGEFIEPDPMPAGPDPAGADADGRPERSSASDPDCRGGAQS